MSDTLDMLGATADMRGESTPEEPAQVRYLNERHVCRAAVAVVDGVLPDAVPPVACPCSPWMASERRPHGVWDWAPDAGLSSGDRF